MAELLIIVFVAFVGIFALATTIGIGILVLKYLDHRRKTINYVEKQYTDLVQFTKLNCPNSLYGYNLERATTKASEGRSLGVMVGYAYLSIDLKGKEKKEGVEEGKEKTVILEKVMRHFITYRPKEAEFNLLNPATWRPQYKIAIISNTELPYGLNGTTRWETESIDWYKFYVYSTSDVKLTREVLTTKITDDVKLDFATKSWEEVGEIANKAADSDTSLLKGIKKESEYRPRSSK